jgi:adenine-specific DNA-methyltransferase
MITFWLRKKGKMQGNNYQLDKKPLLEIPIYQTNKKQEKQITDLVDKIITKKAKNENTASLEAKIDTLIYKMYDLTAEEILLIENEVSIL